MSICDQCCFILQQTNDGDDLSPGDLALVEAAINGWLTPAGQATFAALVAKVQSGYTPPWFCGIEHMTRDHQGYVYWKGQTVEHYDHDLWRMGDWQAKMLADATELADRCRQLEAKGIAPSVTTAVFRWPEILSAAPVSA